MTRDTGEGLSLNKAQVLAGLRCHKLLWFSVHLEHPPELARTPETLVRFEEGKRVGEEARKRFPDGANMAPGGNASQAAVVERTVNAIAAGTETLFEAGLSAEGASLRADVLQKDAAEWRIIEVKQSKWPEKERDREKKFELHVPDVGVQAWVAGAARIPVRHSHLMYLNPDCTHPDLSNLFTTVDVTTRVEQFVPAMPGAMRAMHGALALPNAPDVPVGDQCVQPEECPFYDRCHPKLPDFHVTELYYAKKHAAKLEAAGKTMLRDLDESDAPNDPAKRQVRSAKLGRRVVEPTLRGGLERLKGPIIHLDFETVQLAVPRWHGCHPQDMVAVQFSVHRESPAGTEHIEYLAERGGDPRPALIEKLVDACRGAATILVYFEPFEKKRLEELSEWFPARRDALMDIHARIVDLLPIVRDHVYDPAFHGSFSLKKVLPALVPDLGYSDLRIQEGGTASAELYRLLFGAELDAAEERALRADLLAYCRRDTEAMVRLLGVLRNLST